MISYSIKYNKAHYVAVFLKKISTEERLKAKDVGTSKCQHIWNSFYISWDGHLLLRCTKPISKLFSLGEIINTNIQDAINTEYVQHIRRCAINKEYPDFCAQCHMLCKG